MNQFKVWKWNLKIVGNFFLGGKQKVQLYLVSVNVEEVSKYYNEGDIQYQVCNRERKRRCNELKIRIIESEIKVVLDKNF